MTSFINKCEFRASSESNLNSTLAKEDAEAENQEGKVMRVVVGVFCLVIENAWRPKQSQRR